MFKISFKSTKKKKKDMSFKSINCLLYYVYSSRWIWQLFSPSISLCTCKPCQMMTLCYFLLFNFLLPFHVLPNFCYLFTGSLNKQALNDLSPWLDLSYVRPHLCWHLLVICARWDEQIFIIWNSFTINCIISDNNTLTISNYSVFAHCGVLYNREPVMRQIPERRWLKELTIRFNSTQLY